MEKIFALSACLGLLLLGCSDELAPTAALPDAESVVAAKNAQVIPHKGVSFYHPTLVEPTDDPQVVHIFFEGEGEATHFGHYTETGDYYLHSDADGTPLFIDHATITITVASGDQVFIENLTAVVTLTGDPGNLIVDGEYDYVGGTGRFAAVSGHLHFRAQSGVSHFQGTISTVGSTR